MSYVDNLVNRYICWEIIFTYCISYTHKLFIDHIRYNFIEHFFTVFHHNLPSGTYIFCVPSYFFKFASIRRWVIFLFFIIYENFYNFVSEKGNTQTHWILLIIFFIFQGKPTRFYCKNRTILLPCDYILILFLIINQYYFVLMKGGQSYIDKLCIYIVYTHALCVFFIYKQMYF